MEVASIIKAKRKEIGMSQYTLGKKLGYTSAQFVSNWERNLALPPPETIKKISKIIGARPGELETVYLNAKVQKLKAQLHI